MEVDVKPAAISLSYPPCRQTLSVPKSLSGESPSPSGLWSDNLAWQKEREMESCPISCCSLIALFVLEM